MLEHNSKGGYALTARCILILGVLLLNGCGNSQNQIELPVLDAIGGDFTLPSTRMLDNGQPGASLTLSTFQGQVVLINFGYSYCPDVCPTVLARMARLSKTLQAEHGLDAQKLKMVFMTVDPERDTLAHLKDYLAFFSPDLIGVRGSIEQTKKVTKQYAVYFEKQAADSEDYTVMHSDKIFLLDKMGRLRALYGHSDSDDSIINAILSVSS